MARIWGTTVGLLALAAAALSGCSSPAPAAPDTGAAPAAEEVLDLTDPQVLQDVCQLNDEAMDSDLVVNSASRDVPDYWAANFPVPAGDDVYCEQMLTSNNRTSTWVYFDGAAESLPVVEQWMDEVEAAGYPPVAGPAFATRDVFRAVANGDEAGIGTIQYLSDTLPYFASVRVYGEESLQILIQQKVG